MENPEQINYFAETDFRQKHTRFGIKNKDRPQHVYVIGKTGTGKTTMLENMAVQDIQSGAGVAFLDPHGETAEKLLSYVPEDRIKDVIYFAPFDLEWPISFNILEDVGKDKRHLVVSGLMSTFKKIWVDAWSARMEYMLTNTLLALLEFPGATLLGVNRMYADKEYRKVVAENVTDPGVRSFWLEEFAKYTDRFAAEATPAIQNKVGQFTSNPIIRNIIGQTTSSFDFRSVMDSKKIFIANLSKGRIGETNTSLLGSMIITKLYLAAMSRADTSANIKKMPNFYLYVDEFQSFANESFANILSEARKYKLNLTIAHQYVEQMTDEVRDAVFGNVGTLISFRVGPFDAEVLEQAFGSKFTQDDLVNLDFAQIYLSLLINGVGSPPFSARTLPPVVTPDVSYRDAIAESSRKIFARPRVEAEGEIQAWYKKDYGKDLGQVRQGKDSSGSPRYGGQQGGQNRNPNREKRRERDNQGGSNSVRPKPNQAPSSNKRQEASRPPQKANKPFAKAIEGGGLKDLINKAVSQKPKEQKTEISNIKESPKPQIPPQKPPTKEIPEDDLKKMLN